MGTNYYAVRKRPSIEKPIHIGKSSYGWKFLFATHNDTWSDPPVVWDTYDQVIEWLTKYTVERKDYVILNEYDNEIELADFIDLVHSQQRNDNPEDFKYNRNVDGYRFADGEFW